MQKQNAAGIFFQYVIVGDFVSGFEDCLNVEVILNHRRFAAENSDGGIVVNILSRNPEILQRFAFQKRIVLIAAEQSRALSNMKFLL